MNREDIIRMAREASLNVTYIGDPIGLTYAQVAHFAQLVAAAEREACAKLADGYDDMIDVSIANAIRKRGQQ